MNEEDIMDYVMHNPQNTNPAILRGMLDQYNGGGSGSGAYVLGITFGENVWTLSETASDIYDAAKTQPVVAIGIWQEEGQPDNIMHLQLASASEGDNDRVPYYFYFFNEFSGSLTSYGFHAAMGSDNPEFST